jgi:tetraacyldisaccharide 4'-kinase
MNFPPFVRWLLSPFSLLYGIFVRLRAWCYRRGVFKAKRLAQPVISIGNLTVGGTGKTPTVLWLAQRLQIEGKRVGILSRGYHRGHAPGEGPESSAERVPSDEVRLLSERLHVPFGVGADRYRTAIAMERDQIEVFLLDDGFQHQSLARDLDIVLLDASNPFGGAWLLPAGPLREPPSALSRANIVLITRSEHAPAVETLVRRHCPAPIFYAQTRLAGVLERSRPAPGNRAVDPKQYRYLVFCGLGNPQAFRDDLSRWGIQVLGSTFFRDHHQYAQREADQLERLAMAMGANALLCTEKDVFNLEGVQFNALPVHFCRIDMNVSNEDGFLAIVHNALHLVSERSSK